MNLDQGQDGRSQKYVHSVARAITSGDPHLAEDLAQDVFLIALVNSPRDESRRRPWLRSITKNTLKYARFRAATLPKYSNNAEAELSATMGRELDPAQSLTKAEIADRVRGLLRTLPEKQREIVRMRAIEELSAREVASQLGIPIETVRTRYRRSLETLREAADRNAEGDPLSEWQVPAALAWIWPRRAALGAVGAVSVLAVGAAWLWGQKAEPDVPGAVLTVDAPAEPSALRSPIDLAPPRAMERAPGAPAFASADLRLSSESAALAAEKLTLRSRAGDFVVGQTDGSGALHLTGLEPGQWTAWHRGQAIGAKALKGGANSWELAIEQMASIKVRVVDEDGQPVPLVDVYRLDDATNRTEPIGLTDAAGSLEARVPLSGSWVAARGEPGMSSSAAYLDQPMVQDGDGALQLVLESHPVSWHEVRFEDDVPESSRTVVARHDRARGTTRQFLLRGMHRSSVWLPPWRRADGAHGVRPEQGVTLIAVDETGEPWWISRDHRLTQPLEPILEAKPPLEVSGRLVDAEGHPLPGLEIAVVGSAAYGMTTLKVTTGPGGRFRLGGCPGDLIRLASAFGRQALVRRRAGERAIDIGEWDIERVTVDVEAFGSQGPWKCTVFRPAVRKSLPELNTPLGEFTHQVLAESASDVCRVEIARPVLGGAILVEAGHGKDARATFVRRPEDGWTEGPLQVDLSSARPVQLRAQIAPERFPIRGVWVDDEFNWTSPALADSASGSISSGPLPAGRWSLRVVDRFSLTAQSKTAAVKPGDQYDFGALVVDSGRARVSLPSDDAGFESRGGALQVTGVDSVFVATEFIPAGDLVPLEIVTELPVGRFRFSLRLNGRFDAVGEAAIERGVFTDVTLSRDHIFVGLAFADVPRKEASGASLKVLDGTGRELWEETLPDPSEHLGGTVWFTVPRLPDAQLCTELRGGQVVPNLLGKLDAAGIVVLPFEAWSGLGK